MNNANLAPLIFPGIAKQVELPLQSRGIVESSDAFGRMMSSLIGRLNDRAAKNGENLGLVGLAFLKALQPPPLTVSAVPSGNGESPEILRSNLIDHVESLIHQVESLIQYGESLIDHVETLAAENKSSFMPSRFTALEETTICTPLALPGMNSLSNPADMLNLVKGSPQPDKLTFNIPMLAALETAPDVPLAVRLTETPEGTVLPYTIDAPAIGSGFQIATSRPITPPVTLTIQSPSGPVFRISDAVTKSDYVLREPLPVLVSLLGSLEGPVEIAIRTVGSPAFEVDQATLVSWQAQLETDPESIIRISWRPLGLAKPLSEQNYGGSSATAEALASRNMNSRLRESLTLTIQRTPTPNPNVKGISGPIGTTTPVGATFTTAGRQSPITAAASLPQEEGTPIIVFEQAKTASPIVVPQAPVAEPAASGTGLALLSQNVLIGKTETVGMTQIPVGTAPQVAPTTPENVDINGTISDPKIFVAVPKTYSPESQPVLGNVATPVEPNVTERIVAAAGSQTSPTSATINPVEVTLNSADVSVVSEIPTVLVSRPAEPKTVVIAQNVNPQQPTIDLNSQVVIDTPTVIEQSIVGFEGPSEESNVVNIFSPEIEPNAAPGAGLNVSPAAAETVSTNEPTIDVSSSVPASPTPAGDPVKATVEPSVNSASPAVVSPAPAEEPITPANVVSSVDNFAVEPESKVVAESTASSVVETTVASNDKNASVISKDNVTAAVDSTVVSEESTEVSDDKPVSTRSTNVEIATRNNAKPAVTNEPKVNVAGNPSPYSRPEKQATGNVVAQRILDVPASNDVVRDVYGNVAASPKAISTEGPSAISSEAPQETSTPGVAAEPKPTVVNSPAEPISQTQVSSARPEDTASSSVGNSSETDASNSSVSAQRRIDEFRLVQRMVRSFRVLSEQGGGTVQIRLSPPSLGLITIRMDVVERTVRAVLQATNESTRQIIERNLSEFSESLSRKGLELTSMAVKSADAGAQTGGYRFSGGDNQGQGQFNLSGQTGQGRQRADQGHANPQQSTGREGSADDKTRADSNDPLRPRLSEYEFVA